MHRVRKPTSSGWKNALRWKGTGVRNNATLDRLDAQGGEDVAEGRGKNRQWRRTQAAYGEYTGYQGRPEFQRPTRDHLAKSQGGGKPFSYLGWGGI